MEELIEPERTRIIDTDPDEDPVEADRPLSSTRVETHRVRPSLLSLLAWIIGIALIVVLIVLLARWIYHKSHHTVSPAPAVSQQSSVNSSRSKTSGNQTENGNSSATSTNPSSNPPITNTGPGNVAAVFAGSTIAAAGLHYIISLRRFNKTSR